MVERIYNKSHIQQEIPHTLFIKWELGSLKLPIGQSVTIRTLAFIAVVHRNVTIL